MIDITELTDYLILKVHDWALHPTSDRWERVLNAESKIHNAFQEMPNWVSVTDALPENFKTVWGYQDCSECVDLFYCDGEEWFWAAGPYVPQCHVTYWQEQIVPERPEVKD